MEIFKCFEINNVEYNIFCLSIENILSTNAVTFQLNNFFTIWIKYGPTKNFNKELQYQR